MIKSPKFEHRSLLAPDKLSAQLATLYWDDDLVVVAMNLVPILEIPSSVTLRLVALELPLEIRTVGVSPSTFKKLVLVPFPNIFHASRTENVSACPVLFTVMPVA